MALAQMNERRVRVHFYELHRFRLAIDRLKRKTLFFNCTLESSTISTWSLRGRTVGCRTHRAVSNGHLIIRHSSL